MSAENKATFLFQGEDKLTPVLKKIQGQFDKFRAKGQRSTASIARGADRAANSMSRLQTKMMAVTRVGSGLGRSMMGLGAALGVGLGIKGIFTLGTEMEKTKVAFQTMLGSDSKGSAMVAQINDLANVTPYMNSNLLKSAEMMMGFGIEQEKIIPNLKMLGEIARGDSNRLSSLSLAFSQMSSAGRLMGQDLNQMINAGFNPLKTMSEETGFSIAFLKKQMEKGAISSDMVTEAFKAATGAGGQFEGMMEKMSKTVGGMMSTIAGKIQLQIINAFEKNTPKMVKFLKFFDKNLEKILKTVKSLIMTFGIYMAVMKGFPILLGAATTATNIFRIALGGVRHGAMGAKAAFMALNTTMKSNIAGLAMAGISALVVAIINLRNKTKQARLEKEKLDDSFSVDPILKNFGGKEGIGKMTEAGIGGNVSWYKIKKGLDKWINEAPLSSLKEVREAMPKVMEETQFKLNNMMNSAKNPYSKEHSESLKNNISILEKQLGWMKEIRDKLELSIPEDNFSDGGVLGDQGVSLSTSRIAKNLTINIGEMVAAGGITINTNTFNQSTEELKDRLEEVFKEIALDMAKL